MRFLFGFLLLTLVCCHSNAQNGIPIGVIIDDSPETEVKHIITTAINHINNGIKLGRNRWLVHITMLKTTDTNELMRSICELMSKGVLAIFSYSNTFTQNSIDSMLNSYRVPFISVMHPFNNEAPATLNQVEHGANKDESSHVIESILGKHAINEVIGSVTTTPEQQAKSSTDQKEADDAGNERPKSPNSHLSIHPDMTPLLVSLIKYSRWSSIYYVYNHKEGLNRLEGLLNFQMKETDFVTDILARKIDHIDESINLLKSIEKMSAEMQNKSNSGLLSNNQMFEITMMIDLDTKEDYLKFLENIKKLDMIKTTYHYLLVTMAIHEIDLQEFRQTGLNITGFSVIDYKNVNTMTLLSEALQVNIKPNQLPNISYKSCLLVDALLLFNKQINHLIGKNMNQLFGLDNVSAKNGEIYYGNRRGLNCKVHSSHNANESMWPVGDFIIDNLINMPTFEGLTGPMSFDSTGKRVNYSIDIYRSVMNLPLAKIGTFSKDNGLKILEEAIYRERDSYTEINRNRKRIVVSITDAPFFMIKPQDASGKPWTGNDRFMGFCVDLAEHLSKIVNFTYEFRLVKDGKFGAKDANGNWNGMVGELIRHEADLAIAGLTITMDRERVVEFSMPFMNLGISIMVYKKKEQQPEVLSFMKPLSNSIWICVLLAYVAISVILFLVSRFSPYEWNLEYVLGEQRLMNDFNLFNTLWFCLAAFMQQGIDIAPKCISGRLVTCVWWFFTLILISSYTANLAAFLTFERMTDEIQSAEDLAKQTKIKYGAVEGGSTQAFFRTSKVKTYQKMWSTMSGLSGQVFVKSNLEGVEKVRKEEGNYAFLLESSVNEYLNEREPCNTMKVGPNLDSKGYGIATPIGSDLKEAINLAVLQLREEGTLEFLKKKWWIDRSECGGNQKSSPPKDASNNSLSLANVAGIFYILIIGLVISVIIAAFEVLYKARVENKRSKMIFEEAYKPKLRLNIGVNEEIIDPEERKELKPMKNGKKSEYGWSLEPPKQILK